MSLRVVHPLECQSEPLVPPFSMCNSQSQLGEMLPQSRLAALRTRILVGKSFSSQKLAGV